MKAANMTTRHQKGRKKPLHVFSGCWAGNQSSVVLCRTKRRCCVLNNLPVTSQHIEFRIFFFFPHLMLHIVYSVVLFKLTIHEQGSPLCRARTVMRWGGRLQLESACFRLVCSPPKTFSLRAKAWWGQVLSRCLACNYDAVEKETLLRRRRKKKTKLHAHTSTRTLTQVRQACSPCESGLV